MNNLLKIALVTGTIALVSSVAVAQSSYGSGSKAHSAKAKTSASFVKKRYNINGTWSVTEQNGQQVIKFNNDFKTKGGPDLKVFLSSNSISELSGKSVIGSSLKLSVLKSNKGAQSYIIPAGVNLSDYKSVVIHCEAFSVLWGGFDLAE